MIYKNENKDISAGELNLIFRARMLWRDLATWLRSYLISTYAGLDIQQAISERLYRIPLEYGNILKLFFGDKITEDYINLLSNYVKIFEFLFNAQKSGDINAVNEYTRQLYENDNQRAAFLSSINPYWQEDTLKSLMYSFTSKTIDESTTFLTREYQKNIEIFDSILNDTTIMGDYFSEGLLNYLNYNQEPTNMSRCY